MDAPPPHEDQRPFVASPSGWRRPGLSAPEKSSTGTSTKACGCWLTLAMRGCARQSMRSGERAAACTNSRRPPGHIHNHPPMPGLPVHGLETWLEELMLFQTVLPGARSGGGREGLSGGVDRGARAGSVGWAGAGDDPARLSRGERDVDRRPGGRRSSRAARFSRTRGKALAYDSRRYWRTRGATSPRAIERSMIDRYTAATGQSAAFRARITGPCGAAQHAHPGGVHAAVEA